MAVRSPPALRSPPGAPTAVVVASDEETRVLLRGLLRLNRFRVVGESDDPRRAADLVSEHRPQLLLADAGPMQEPMGEILKASRRAVAGLRIVLVTGASRGGPTPWAAHDADAVLVRPFRVRQFLEAIGVPAS